MLQFRENADVPNSVDEQIAAISRRLEHLAKLSARLETLRFKAENARSSPST